MSDAWNKQPMIRELTRANCQQVTFPALLRAAPSAPGSYRVLPPHGSKLDTGFHWTGSQSPVPRSFRPHCRQMCACVTERALAPKMLDNEDNPLMLRNGKHFLSSGKGGVTSPATRTRHWSFGININIYKYNVWIILSCQSRQLP